MLPDTSHDPWMVRTAANPKATLRLFCFPYAGGGASTYRSWSAHLPAEIEVTAIQLPGREERLREPALSSTADICTELLAVLRPHLDRPFAFFGHSMGALIAFELTRRLRAANKPQPQHLFVSAHRGPQRPSCLPPLGGMSDRELVNLIRSLGGTRDEVLRDPDVMKLMLPLLRADLTVCETYRYEPAEALTCPISAFGGTADDFIRRSDILAWRAETSAGYQARMFPGGHFFLEEARARLLQAIAEDLSAPLVSSNSSKPHYTGGLAT